MTSANRIAGTSFTGAGWAKVAGRTDIIPINVSPKEINPNTTAAIIVKFPVAKSNIAEAHVNAQAVQ